MNLSVAPLFLLPHSSSKLELPMNFNAIFKNVKIIKIGLLDAKLQTKTCEINAIQNEDHACRKTQSYTHGLHSFTHGPLTQ